MKKPLFLLMCLATAMGAAAADWYVNADNYGKSGLTGKTEELAYGTIQDAITPAASGDTIYVAPGVYDKGLGKAVASWGKSRIGWNSKKLYIYSTGGAEVTHIVGEKSTAETATALGTGPGAVRCLSIYDLQNANCGGTIFKGFTFRDGATVSALSEGDEGVNLQAQALEGGAVRISHSEIYFADCVFRNCSADSAGVAYNGTFVRCRFERNAVLRRDSRTIIHGYSSADPARLYSCVLHHNSYGDEATSTGGAGIMMMCVQAVNCTLLDNHFGSCCYTKGERFWNCIMYRSGSYAANCAYTNCVKEAAEPFPVMSTIFVDTHLRPGSAAITAGDGQYTRLIPLPEELDYEDIDGNLPATSGTVAAGATQTVGTPAAGAIIVNDNNGVTCVDGVLCKTGDYVYPTQFPTQYLFSAIVTDPTKRLAYFYFGNGSPASNYDYRFPSRDDTLWVMPPANTAAALTNRSTSVAKVVYASPDADASVADGSADRPYRTLIDAYANGSVIVAKPGVYAEGVTNSPTYGRSRLQVGNVKRVTSEAGPEQTIILGEADTSEDADEYGCGPNAVRCVTASANMTQIQGFTLTGGRTQRTTGNFGQGGAAYGNDYLDLDDCIITNNFAREGIIRNSRMQRCYVAGNRSELYLAFAGSYRGSVFENNTVANLEYGLFGNNSRLVNCTVLSSSGQLPCYTTGIRCYSTVFLGSGTGTLNALHTSAGNVCWGLSKVSDANALVADPLLADPDNDDWHPFTSSPVFTVGVTPSAGNYGADYWKYATTDFEGNPLVKGNARLVAGAFVKPTARRMVAVYAQNGGLSPAATRVVLGEGETYTLGVGDDMTRPLVGVTVNGVTNEISSSAWTLTVSGAEATGGYSVVALYSNVWYAAPEGDDEALGSFPSAAKSLQGALTNENLMAGDRVVALPGTYRTGKMVQKGDALLHSRAVVPSKVTLESRDGRDVTIIEGAEAETPDPPPGTSTYDVRGCGVDAIRCVYLASGATVKGFTLTNGWTRTMVGGTAVDHESAETCGGGAFCVDGTSVVEDCLAIGCGAYRGAGAKGGQCLNSTFANNYALYGGGGTSDSYNNGCISYGNTAMTWDVNAGIFYIRGAVNCTVLDSLSQAPGTFRGITNCLVLGTFFPSGIPSNVVSHCIFNKAKLYGMPTGYMNWTEASFSTNLDAIAVDSDNRPIIGQSICVDAGTLNLPVKLPAKDQTGTQRVYNGAIDVGALEADWRPRYARDITLSSRFTVTNATEQVTESAQGTVRLAPGERLAADWTGLAGRGAKTTLKVRVTGTGALTVTLDGAVAETVTSEDGERELTFTVPSAGCGLELSYAMVDGDTGYAEILGSDVLSGTFIRLR